MRGSVGSRALVARQARNLVGISPENRLLYGVDSGALACWYVEPRKNAFPVVQDINAEGGLALTVGMGGRIGRWRRFMKRVEGLMEVGIG